jgi:hypothetical protein
MTEEDIDGYGGAPVQFLAPEIDHMFPDELKMKTFQKLVRLHFTISHRLHGSMKVTHAQVLERRGNDGLPVEWVHFPGMAHGCLTKGDETNEGEREAMIRGKDSAVAWFKQWLSE